MISVRAVNAVACYIRLAGRHSSPYSLIHSRKLNLFGTATVQETFKDHISDEHDIVPNHLQLYSTSSVNKIMDTIQQEQLHEIITVNLLKALRVQVLLNKAKFSDFSDRDSFIKLCKSFEENCHKLQPSMLISGLRSLFIIGLDPHDESIEKIEKVILANIPMFQMIDVISCLHLHSKNLKTPLQKAVAATLVDEIQNRKFQIKQGSEALMLVELITYFGKEHLRKIEENLINFIDHMELQDCVKCICCLAEQGVRLKSLLKELSRRFQSIDKPNMKDSVSIMFSLLSLNYFDQKLLFYLTNDRRNDVLSIENPSLISALLTACGQLRWRHSELLDACCQWMSKHLSTCSPRELVSFMLTLATLCYIPEEKSLLKCVFWSLDQNKMDSKIWLDAIWASAILDNVDKNTLLKVVSTKFRSQLLGSADENLPVQTKVKLMNLMTVLKNKHPELVFSCDLFLDVDGISKSEKYVICKNVVLSTLKTLIPENNMGKNLNTNLGITIDAEFIISKNGKPLRLSEYGLKAKPSVVTKNLPPGAKRIALMIWLHKDMTLNETVLTGGNALAIKLLSLEGYTVVQVPYEAFCKNPTAVLRAKYLWNLIQNCLEK